MTLAELAHSPVVILYEKKSGLYPHQVSKLSKEEKSETNGTRYRVFGKSERYTYVLFYPIQRLIGFGEVEKKKANAFAKIGVY